MMNFSPNQLDNTACRKILSNIAAKQGFQCDTAEDGEIALHMVERAKISYDVVFLDNRMPNIVSALILACYLIGFYRSSTFVMYKF